ncbi:DNA alkylation repair protein [bacterium]|nr:DNA alkylation repair protein [bacterium]MBU4361538.1 DNA alkylation repair protein [bacterium]MBU4601838.1 DNA alkylation repair protein [bacterium]MCG2761689.1 DNA alkylation repair protein [Candidatus Atribacteria bacterium]
MIDDVIGIIEKGIHFLNDALPEIRKLASHKDWKKREDAATALVEISKKKEDEVIREMIIWAEDKDHNIRRVASEGLRGVARRNPEKVLPVIEKLKTDDSLYVKKSVAALLKAISKKNPEFVLGLCRKWAKSKNKNTQWIIKDGMKKLSLGQQEELKSLLGG